MSDFPSAVISPRTIENRPGVTYDANDTKTLYAEDLEAITAEIVAIENFLRKAREGSLWNGKIVVTVGNNDITLALKNFAGNNPSAGDPVAVIISGVFHLITSALSITLADGINYFNAGSAELATKEIDYFAYLGYNATDGVTIGFARIPFALRYSDFSATNTDEKYCAISDIDNAASGDPYVLIGRFAATLSATATFYWSVPAFTPLNLVQRPIYETRMLSWVPTLTGYSGTPSYTAYYQVVGRQLFIDFYCSGTSNATTLTAIMPFVLHNNHTWPITCVDNGAYLTAFGRIVQNGTAIVTMYTNAYTGAWTNANTKSVRPVRINVRIT